jgi:hypothetical protein
MITVARQQTLQEVLAIAAKIPPNIAGDFSQDQLEKIFSQMFTDYIWPQVTTRLPFEAKWDTLKEMYKAQRDKSQARSVQKQEETTINFAGEDPLKLADTLIFDTVDRLTRLNYFISWKDRPVQYNMPPNLFTPLEDQFYNPTNRKLQMSNAALDWNNETQNVRGKHTPLCQHHYLYGHSFTHCDFVLDVEPDPRSPDFLLVKDIGTTFTPVSTRKLWLNPMLPIDEMEKQVCPFFFDVVPRSQVLENQYDPKLNPFGFLNLDKLGAAQWLYGPEAKAFTDALPQGAKGIMTQMRPEYSGEALWTFYPYLTLPSTRNNPDKPKVQRYIVQCFANNLFSGKIVPIRIQKLFYPHGRLPLFGCAHIPDLDSGMYTPAIGEILESHYVEIVRATEQYILNKDWINNPPTEVQMGSPAATNSNINRPGARYEVTGPNDVNRRQPYDATQTTSIFIETTDKKARTTGKAVDAIMGEAMGGRTTATEASNAFQASMSGVTADIDCFSLAHYKNYAIRHWENLQMFMPKSIRDRICGVSDATPLDDQDLLVSIGIKTDVGSTFIESIVKQQHLQQAIASSTTSPFLDQAMLWKALFRELRLTEALDAVKDNGFEFQVSTATTQAVETYYGKVIAIDPSQDHQIAITVKTRFLQDVNSTYNEEMAGLPSPHQGMTRAQYLAYQIQIHQQFVMLQQKQAMMIQEAQLMDEHRQQLREFQLKQQQIQNKGAVRAPSGPAQPQNPAPMQGAPNPAQ